MLLNKKQIPWNKGKKLSEETKKKISETNKRLGIKPPSRLGKKTSEETKMKLSEAHKKLGTKPPSSLGRKRSEETKRKMSGKNNHNWQGGITPENIKIRTSLEYKLWRKACMERDNFVCQKTGISGGRLEVHHIHNFADYPELRLAIDNGITLSEKAHRDFHKIYGKSNNTKQQLLEFIN